jgi:hypothetical protein
MPQVQFCYALEYRIIDAPTAAVPRLPVAEALQLKYLLDYFTFITILEGDAARLSRWPNRPDRLIALFFAKSATRRLFADTS